MKFIIYRPRENEKVNARVIVEGKIGYGCETRTKIGSRSWKSESTCSCDRSEDCGATARKNVA